MDSIFGEYSNNQYPFGGLFPITVPAAVRGAGKWLRDRMYRTVMPEGYSMEQVENFVKGKSREYYRNPNVEALLGKYTGQDSIIADATQSPDYMPSDLGRILSDSERIKLGVDNKELRKYAVDDIIIPSKSKEGAFEFAYPNRSGNELHIPVNANDVSDESWPHSHELGTFRQVKDKDSNGTSVTYEDTWDINPFRGVSSKDDNTPIWKSAIETGRVIGLDKIGDILPFGKPFEIHGKQYYDKNGKPVKKAEGGFLYQPKDAWDALSMLEKSEMMKVAVRNGITDLKTIREKYNEFAEGGQIEIKPENRGKFTALKERTGHSATWFKEHGTPAQKKMATFDLNSRHWKHGLGGNLFGEAGQMQIGRNYWQSRTQEPTFMESLTEFNRQQEFKKQQQREVLRQKINTVGRKRAEERMRESQTESNDNAWVETPLTYRQKNPHLSRKAEEGAKAHAAWEKEHPNLTAWGNVLGATPFVVAAYPFAATAGAGLTALGDAAAATTVGQGITNFLAPVATTSVAGATVPQWLNLGLTSGFGAHGIQTAVDEGGISPMTALEIAPMLQVVKPAINMTTTAIENYRVPLGKPQVPKRLFSYPTRFSEEESFIPNFFLRKKKPIITKESILNDINESKSYKESDGYRNLVESFLKEAGENIPSDVFYNSRHSQIPNVILEKRPRNHLGSYKYSENRLSVDPEQAEADVSFHEGLHWQRVGAPEVEKGSDYTAWLEALDNNAPQEVQKELWSRFYDSEVGTKALKQERAIDDLYKNKVEKVLYPDVPKDSEMRKPSELIAHPFGIGKSMGLKPFQEYPGYDKALEIIKKARKKDSYLYDIKAGTEDEVRDFWRLLTGNYMPITIGGVLTTGLLTAKE